MPRRQFSTAFATGFTLVELVVTLIVLGIMAVAILPRFASRETFDTRGFTDQARSALQFARKVAVASGRNVCSVTTASTLTLTMATARGQGAACTAAVLNPASGGAYVLSAPSGVSLSVLTVTFRADGSAAALVVTPTLTVTGDGSTNTITIEGATGHVH